MTTPRAGRGILASLLLLASAPCFSADASVARVDQFLGSLKTLAAGLVQVVRNDVGAVERRRQVVKALHQLSPR